MTSSASSRPARTPSTTPCGDAVIHLICALPCEARPLICHYGLEPVPSSGFPAWRRAGLTLTLSGIGKMAAAAAVAHSRTLVLEAADSVRGWLNVGVAGHAQLPRGEAALMHQVTEQSSGRSWYPRLVFTPPCPEQALVTVDQPTHDYPSQALCDMEGAGFLDAAQRYSPPELTHCLKIVSDRPGQPLEPRRDAGRVSDWIGARLALIDALLETLSSLQMELEQHRRAPPGWEQLRRQRHFSASQQVQLRRLLRQWAQLLPGVPLPCTEHRLPAAVLLRQLRERIGQRALEL